MTWNCKTVEELASNIKEAFSIDKDYDPEKDIKDFISQLPKPNMLVVLNGSSFSQLFTDRPDSVGKSMLCSFKSSNARFFDIRPADLTDLIANAEKSKALDDEKK